VRPPDTSFTHALPSRLTRPRGSSPAAPHRDDSLIPHTRSEGTPPATHEARATVLDKRGIDTQQSPAHHRRDILLR